MAGVVMVMEVICLVFNMWYILDIVKCVHCQGYGGPGVLLAYFKVVEVE